MIVDATLPDATPSTIQTPADLGRAICDKRTDFGLLQADIAMHSGVSTPAISAIEGKHRVTS